MQSKNPSPNHVHSLLLYANPEWVSDLYSLTGLMTPDPYIALQHPEGLVVAVSPLEYGRAVKHSRASVVVDTGELQKRARKHQDGGMSPEGSQIYQLLQEHGVESVEVTRDFPFYLAEELKSKGVSLKPLEGSILPQRIRKSEAEVNHIRDAIRITQLCFDRVKSILSESGIERGNLRWQGEWLTSERVHMEIEKVCLGEEAIGGNPIVAGGDQACDPHERGHGILRANELIIVDIFPRSKRHHFWGDLTRTFLKGKPTADQKQLVATVAEAQKLAIDQITDGAVTGDIHSSVDAYFVSKNYRTETKNGVYQGFFHGTGHGFGLDIHEPPRIGKSQEVRLQSGMVVTVEPGLYYPGLGGCRIEDDVLVTENGCEVLSDFPYDWVIE